MPQRLMMVQPPGRDWIIIAETLPIKQDPGSPGIHYMCLGRGKVSGWSQMKWVRIGECHIRAVL